MFNPQQLAEILDLHEKSYGLLRWVNSALKQDVLSFSTVHESTDTTDAAAEWIKLHLSNIPQDTRPNENQVDLFAKLFVSFFKRLINWHQVELLFPDGDRLVVSVVVVE